MPGGELVGRVAERSTGAPGGGQAQEAQEEAFVWFVPRLLVLPR